MNPLNRFQVTHGAHTDARHGITSVEERLLAELGPRPKLDTTGNSEHAEYAKALANRAEVEELREDVTRAEDEATNHPSVFFSALGLGIALLVEVVGASLIIEVVGVSDRERLPLSLALAFAVIGLTALTAQRTSTVRSMDAQRGGVLQAAKRSAVTLVLIGVYALVVLAIAIVRVAGSLADDAAPLEVLARTVVMLFATLGPPWLAEWLIRRRAPAVLIRRRIRTLRRRLHQALRARERAQAAINRITRAAEYWDRETARRRALYAVEHRLETAKAQAPKPAPSRTTRIALWSPWPRKPQNNESQNGNPATTPNLNNINENPNPRSPS